MSVDTAERRSAIRGSAEVSAAKHLARAYGFSMRRRRRVGPVVFDLAIAGLKAGQLSFFDEGVLAWVSLHDQIQDVTMLELASLMEYGYVEAHVEEAVILDLAVATGPVVLPALPAPVEALPTTDAIPLAVGLTTRSIPIPMVATLPVIELTEQPVEYQPSALGLWARFVLGLILVVQALWPLAILPFGGDPTWTLVAMSVVGAIVGVVTIGFALSANDRRLAGPPIEWNVYA